MLNASSEMFTGRPTTTEPLGSAVALISSAVALSIVIVIVVLLCLQVINAKGMYISSFSYFGLGPIFRLMLA